MRRGKPLAEPSSGWWACRVDDETPIAAQGRSDEQGRLALCGLPIDGRRQEIAKLITTPGSSANRRRAGTSKRGGA